MLNALKSKLIAGWLIVALFAIVGLATTVTAQAEDVSIAILVKPEEGVSRDDALKALRIIRDYKKTQPGFVESVILASKIPDNEIAFVELSRWKSATDWEVLFNSPEFLALIEEHGKSIVIQPAEVFERVD